jgi:Protein of unknown function (DUF2946)
VFVFVVLALQSYVAQTHFHAPPKIRGSIAIASNDAPSTAQSAPLEKREHGKHPPSDDPDHCPICQEILYFGSFVEPFLPTLAPPSAIAPSAIRPIFARVAVKATAHSWFGRAPPL